MSTERDKSLGLAIAQIEKQFGKGSLMRLGEAPHQFIEAFSTGALPLDAALGIGGIPRGRVTEIFGPEGSGKTTLALHVMAAAQQAGGTAAFIDAEHALDPRYAKALGVDIDNLYISQPDTGEQALEICDTLVRSGAIDTVCIDSVAALVPKSEIEGEMGEFQVGAQARLMSQALRKLSGSVNKSNTACIFINQLREKIGTMGYGPTETTPGGRALKFYASVRLRVARKENVKQGDANIGARTIVKIVKNKLAPPFRECEFDIMFGKGISRAGCLIDFGLKQDLLSRSGTWFSYGQERLGQGREGARDFIEKNPEMANELENKIREKLGLPVLGQPTNSVRSSP